MNLCPKCHKNIDLVGRAHNCVPTDSQKTPKITAKKVPKEVIPHSKPVSDWTDKIEPPLKESKASVGACPVCEARRKLKALQMKRYREKKGRVRNHGG